MAKQTLPGGKAKGVQRRRRAESRDHTQRVPEAGASADDAILGSGIVGLGLGLAGAGEPSGHWLDRSARRGPGVAESMRGLVGPPRPPLNSR